MKPKEINYERQREMFKVELITLVNMKHPLVKLAGNINWGEFEKQLGPTYHERLGQPGLGTRLMVSLHYLKYQYDLSDEGVLEQWMEK